MDRRHSLQACLLLGTLAIGTTAFAQTAMGPQAKPGHLSRYLEHESLRYEALVSQPPASGSPEALEDLAAVHRLQSGRTPAEVKNAQRDDLNESIFAFDTVLGPGFSAANLSITAALSQHLREESAVVNPPLKIAFHRSRPFVADKTVSPVCQRTPTNSYPSGHAMVGYLEAFALAQMIPERSDAILRRADDYARNRVICGVHYPSDVAASHTIAAALFAALMTSPRFQLELAQAASEIRNCRLPSRCMENLDAPTKGVSSR